MADCRIKGRDWTLEQIGEQAGVEVGLLVVEVEFTTIRGLRWVVVGENLGLQALCQVVFKFDLGVKGIGSSPDLRQGQT